MKLKLIDFIKENSDWEALLSQAPYCLNISRDQKFGRNLIMFKYSQQDSDFSNDIVKEARGLILDMTDGVVPFSVPFFKFFNYGEPNAASIDWESAIVLEKIDGSIMKVVKYNDELLISTNGCIDAYKCALPSVLSCPFSSFGELFEDAILNQFRQYVGRDGSRDEAIEWFKALLKLPNHTYMFELVSKWNRVVVPHEESKLYFIGLRDNEFLDERPLIESCLINYFSMPKFYDFKSLDECVAATQAMPWDEEGYVVVDKNFNRVKIKSPAYLMVHRMANNGNMSIRRAIDVYMAGECDEILAYFPEYKSEFDEIDKRFNDRFMELGSDAVMLFAKIDDGSLPSRKDQAAWIFANSKHSGLLFKLLNGYVVGDSANIAKYLDELKQIMIDLYHRNASSFVSLLGY